MGDEKETIRPLDGLNEMRGHRVRILTRDRREIIGDLVAFDLHVNLFLREVVTTSPWKNAAGENEVLKALKMFIRGDQVIHVWPDGAA